MKEDIMISNISNLQRTQMVIYVSKFLPQEDFRWKQKMQ